MDILRPTHFCTLLFLMRIQSASELPELIWSLWLVVAFISSTESSVIGYNAQSCIHASVCGSAPANADFNLAADDWCTELSNHERYNVIVSNITNFTQLFLCLWKLLSKSTWLKNPKNQKSLCSQVFLQTPDLDLQTKCKMYFYL